MTAGIRVLVATIGFAAGIALGHAYQFFVSTVSGRLLLATPVSATDVSLGSPTAVATDAAGNIYLAGLYAVFKVDQNGVLTHVAGNGTSNHPEFRKCLFG